MRKYINVDVARRIIDSPRSKEQMLMVLSQAEPADVVEVVRCKECENWDKHWISSTFTENAHHCVVLDNVFDGEFFCACGNRRISH